MWCRVCVHGQVLFCSRVWFLDISLCPWHHYTATAMVSVLNVDSNGYLCLCRVEQLEKQQSENLERFKIRTKELKTSVAKELQEATLDAAGLRRLLQIKNKELRQMKSLAATILDQRSDVEQFFLEALQEVLHLFYCDLC